MRSRLLLAHRRSGLLALAGMALLFSVAARPLPAQQQPLPDSPMPVPATRPNTPEAIRKRRWEGVIEPGEKVPPLTTRDKFLFPVHEELRPLSLIPVVVSGAYGDLRDNDPKVGTNLPAFGTRVGDAALRQASIRFFSDGLLPALLHEDPRYYRKTYGSYQSRFGYSLRRVVVDARDSGKLGFNYSDTVGRGMAAALTQAYYPDRSVHPGVVFRTWGISLIGSAGVNVFQEFWPDAKVKIFKQRVP